MSERTMSSKAPTRTLTLKENTLSRSFDDSPHYSSKGWSTVYENVPIGLRQAFLATGVASMDFSHFGWSERVLVTGVER